MRGNIVCTCLVYVLCVCTIVASCCLLLYMLFVICCCCVFLLFVNKNFIHRFVFASSLVFFPALSSFKYQEVCICHWLFSWCIILTLFTHGRRVLNTIKFNLIFWSLSSLSLSCTLSLG